MRPFDQQARRVVEEAARKERMEAEARELAAARVKETEERAKRDAAEAAEREKRRLANELNDGYEMLAVFVRVYGKRDEFKAVCKAIGPYLKAPA